MSGRKIDAHVLLIVGYCNNDEQDLDELTAERSSQRMPGMEKTAEERRADRLS